MGVSQCEVSVRQCEDSARSVRRQCEVSARTVRGQCLDRSPVCHDGLKAEGVVARHFLVHSGRLHRV